MTRSIRVRMEGTPLLAMGAIVLLATGRLAAQEPTLRAYLEPPEVEVGDSFRLVVEVAGAGEVEDPELWDSQFWFADRRTDRAVPFATEITAPPTGQADGAVTFSYSMVATVAGSFEMGPFEVTADGRELRTKPVTLLVTVPDPGMVSVRARLDRSEVEVGDEFELIVDVTPAGVELPWPNLPDNRGVVATGQRGRVEESMSFGLVATVPGTHQVGPVVFNLGKDVIRTEPVTLVVVGDPQAIEARAFLNTGQTWVGSDVLLVVEAEARELDADPVLPDMSAFAEPPHATGSGTSSDGGRYTVSRNYRMRVVAAGEFEVGPVQVMVRGRTGLTKPMRLVVSEAPPPAPVESPKDLRATATAEQRMVYVGEPLIVTYRLLARDHQPGFEGWRVEADTLVLPAHDNFQYRRIRRRGRWRERVSLDDRVYRVASEHRVMFSPVEAGKTEIEPGEFVVQVNRSREWGNYREMNRAEVYGTWTPVTLTTDPIPIEVVPLPAESLPASFRGHVGKLAVVSWIDRTGMEVGDTVTVRVEVSGLGLLAPDPEIAFPGAFEVSGPEIGPVGRGNSDLHETRRYVFRLVAKQEGAHMLPGVEVSWFDPESRSYGTSGTEPFHVTVAGEGG